MFDLEAFCCYSVSFNSNCPAVWDEKPKIGFQDGGYGSDFGFPIGMILAIFHLHVNLLLHCKFQLNSPCGLRDVQTDFQDGGFGGHLGFPINIILAHFNQNFFLLLHCKFRLKSTKDYGRDVET